MSTIHAVRRALGRARPIQSSPREIWSVQANHGQSKNAATLGCTLLIAASASFGQTATAAETESSAASSQITEVVVVGSRIRRDVYNAPSPVQIVTREEATQAGFASTTELLQGAGVTTGSAQINNAFGGFVTDGGPGANTLSLRGLDPSRTLVLINGRRVAPAGTRGAVGSADLNVLPSAMVERVEVLRDGASSVYGSDAIAGVVNVITMEDVDGLTFEGQYNRPVESGGESARASVVGGLSGDRWSFGGSLEYQERRALTLGDRGWTRCNREMARDPDTGESLDFIDPLTGQPKCYPIGSTGTNGVTINTVGTSTTAGVGAPGSVGTSFNRWRPNSSVTTGVVGFEGVGGGNNSLNVRDTFDPDMLSEDLISPVQLYTLFLQGKYDLQALGNGEMYFEFLGNQRNSQQTGYRQLTLDYRLGSPVIPANLSFSNALPDQGTSDGNRVGVRAFIGFGNTRSEQEVDYYKPTIGLRGDLDLPFLTDWRYDAYLSYSNSDAVYRQQSFLTDKVTYASDVVAATADTDPSLVRNGLTCAINLTNPAERCVPFPMLNSDTLAGDLPEDFRNYILRDVAGHTKYEETVYSAYVDGPVLSLPAGALQAVFGVEHRRAEIDDTPDANSIAGNLYNLTSATPTRGKDNVSELYTEVEVPILANMPFVNALTFSGSFRYTDYDSYGSDTTNKLGLVYRPIDWVSLRFTRGTSFRAPALFEQFQGPTSGFLSSNGDPCNNYSQLSPTLQTNCAQELADPENFQATSSIRVFSEGGAAAGLKAETSENETYGIVLTPTIEGFGDLSVAVDYFDIEITNGVSQPGAGNILDLCYGDPDFRAGGGFCRLVTRDPVTNALTVSNAYTNIGTQIARGIDYNLRYTRDLGPGQMRLNAGATQYKSQASKLFDTDPLDEFNGSIGVPKWSGTADLTYKWNDWQFRYGVDWVGDMDSYAIEEEDPATSIYDLKVGDYFEHFASLRYTADKWEVTGGVRNLFNEEPPSISAGFNNRVGNAPLYSGYDYVGRRVFLNVTTQF